MASGLENIETIESPFRRFVTTIGVFPTAFTNAMTYYECLAYLVKYLEETVIPAVNQNAEALEELQTLFVQLKSFVDNYFDNLDVQEEINNKLDKMVEDGTMDTIINQEIFGQLNNEIDSLNADISLLTNEKVLLIGDSYLQGYNGTSTVNSWGYYFKQCGNFSNDNCKILYEAGAGFIKLGGSGHNFKTLLQENIDSYTDKSTYTSIIVGYGLNDVNEGTESEILNAIVDFANYAKAQFPNAKIYLGCVGNTRRINGTHFTLRNNIYSKTLYAGKEAIYHDIVYLTGVEQVAHCYQYFGDDGIHLSQDGYLKLGKAMYQAWKTGSVQFETLATNENVSLGGNISNPSGTMTITYSVYGDLRTIYFNTFNISFDPVELASNRIDIADSTATDALNCYRNVSSDDRPNFYMMLQLTYSDNTKEIVHGYMRINSSGVMQFTTTSSIVGKTLKGIRSYIPYMYTLNTILS